MFEYLFDMLPFYALRFILIATAVLLAGVLVIPIVAWWIDAL